MANGETSHQRKVIIKIQGTATFSHEKKKRDQVKTLDKFVEDWFHKYKEALQEELKAEEELSFDELDVQTKKPIDPYLMDFNFDTVTKDVH
jgi:hypothetical protein